MAVGSFHTVLQLHFFDCEIMYHLTTEQIKSAVPNHPDTLGKKCQLTFVGNCTFFGSMYKMIEKPASLLMKFSQTECTQNSH